MARFSLLIVTLLLAVAMVAADGMRGSGDKDTPLEAQAAEGMKKLASEAEGLFGGEKKKIPGGLDKIKKDLKNKKFPGGPMGKDGRPEPPAVKNTEGLEHLGHDKIPSDPKHSQREAAKLFKEASESGAYSEAELEELKVQVEGWKEERSKYTGLLSRYNKEKHLQNKLRHQGKGLGDKKDKKRLTEMDRKLSDMAGQIEELKHRTETQHHALVESIGERTLPFKLQNELDFGKILREKAEEAGFEDDKLELINREIEAIEAAETDLHAKLLEHARPDVTANQIMNERHHFTTPEEESLRRERNAAKAAFEKLKNRKRGLQKRVAKQRKLNSPKGGL